MPKVPVSKRKKFYYRRADWGIGKNPPNLENLLREAHNQFDTSRTRTFKLGSGSAIKCAYFTDKGTGSLLFQIATYVPDQATSTVSKSSRAKNLKIGAEPAPEGKDYLDGDVFVLVNGNNVIICPSGTRESAADTYFRKILNKFEIGTETFSLEKIAKASKSKMIQDEGVKEIRLASSLYEATIDDLSTKSSKTKPPSIFSIRKLLAEQVERVFANDPDLKEIQDKENLNIQVTVRFDGKEARKHQKDKGFGSLGKKRLLKSSQMILSEADKDDDGFVIITGAGNEISSNDIRVSDIFSVSTLGKSLDRTDAWKKLQMYAAQLKKAGVFAK